MALVHQYGERALGFQYSLLKMRDIGGLFNGLRKFVAFRQLKYETSRK